MTTTEDILEQLRKARMDLNAANGKLNEAIRLVAELPAQPDQNRKCPTCGVTTRGPLSLAEHMHTSHGAPIPDHWLEAERLAGLTELIEAHSPA